MKKKALEKTGLSVVILSVLGFFMLIALVVGFIEDGKERSDVELCRQSIIVHKNLKTQTGDLLETGLNCPANHHELNIDSKEELAGFIVDELKDCWYKFDAKDNRVGNFWAGLGIEDVILVCSSFSLKENWNMKENIDTKDLYYYFDEIDPKTKKPHFSHLISDWFSNNHSHFFVKPYHEDGGWDGTYHLRELEQIELSKKYYIVYLSYSDNGPLINSKDIESLNWDIQYDYNPEDGISYEYTRHVFVIPEESVPALNPELLYHEEST